MTLAEILALEDIDKKIQYLKKEKESIFDEKSGRTIESPAEYETEEVNRITIPLEQDIVNIQTAFTVGTEPKMECNTEDEDEKSLLTALKSTLQKNKIKYQNKKVVRSWLSEQEVAEYWYATDADSFWDKFWAKVKKTFGVRLNPIRNFVVFYGRLSVATSYIRSLTITGIWSLSPVSTRKRTWTITKSSAL